MWTLWRTQHSSGIESVCVIWSELDERPHRRLRGPALQAAGIEVFTGQKIPLLSITHWVFTSGTPFSLSHQHEC